MPVQKILREHAELSRIMRLWVSDEGVSLCASGFPFRGQIISKRSQSNAKFIYGIKTVMASNYIENLREEVNKGMRAKAETGVYPSRPPFGYTNDKATGRITIDP